MTTRRARSAKVVTDCLTVMPAANLFDAAASVCGILLRPYLEDLRIPFHEFGGHTGQRVEIWRGGHNGEPRSSSRCFTCKPSALPA